jgi:hypothetical protein
MLAREHFARATKAGHDLVEDQKHIVRLAPGIELLQHSLRPQAHAGGALDERLNDHGGDDASGR